MHPIVGNTICLIAVIAAAAYLLRVVYLHNPQRLWERRLGELTEADMSALYIRLTPKEYAYLKFRLSLLTIKSGDRKRTVFEAIHTDFHLN